MAATVFIDAELTGRGNGWTQLSDVIAASISWQRGLPGSTVTDLVAGSGSLKWSMNNSTSNSALTIGYYSPDHSGVLTGWKESIGVRFRIRISSTNYVRFTGVIQQIVPAAGTRRERQAHCEAVGWFDIAATTKLGDLPIQIDQTNDQLFQTLIDSLPDYAQPRAVEKDAGLDTYPYVFDKINDENTKLREELGRLALSGLDRFWERGDGTVVYESRNRRITLATDSDTFTDSHGIIVTRGRAGIINHAHFTNNPRKVGVAASILYSLNSPIELIPGQIQTIQGAWRDPDNPDTRVGAINLITPVAVTDYLVNSAEDGSGTDLTSFLTITLGDSGNASDFELTFGGSTNGFLTFLRQRGQPLLNYGQTLFNAQDDDSIAEHGDRPINVSMPYQADSILAAEAGQYIVYTRKNYRTVVSGFKRVALLTNDTDVLRSINREISDRIRITDSVTGLDKSFYVDSITESIADKYITTTWNFSPVDTTSYWYLEVVGKSELDSTTILGFGYVYGHTDVEHEDIAHGDVAHTDTHTDDAHVDVTHGDGLTHGDSAHSDTAHSDSVHSDVTHVDNHGDLAHDDSPHQDAHADVAHVDVSHQDHDDGTHFDGTLHADTAHEDGHADVRHNDNIPEDSHDDVDHSDIAHGDTSHMDVAHSDNAGHSDSAHADSAHGDVTHGDVTHTDVTHEDVPHGDVN